MLDMPRSDLGELGRHPPGQSHTLNLQLGRQRRNPSRGLHDLKDPLPEGDRPEVEPLPDRLVLGPGVVEPQAGEIDQIRVGGLYVSHKSESTTDP